MLQEEDFDSDSTDEDYVPTEGKGSDDEVSSDGGEAESELDDDDGNNDEVSSRKSKPKTSKKKASKIKKNSKSIPKQKVNPLLAQLGNQEHESPDDDCAAESGEVEVADKKKEEDLWADFLADTEEKPVQVVKPKKKSWAELLGNKKSKPSNCSTSSESLVSGTGNTSATKLTEGAAPKAKLPEPVKSSTVKVTKIFEFAGEEVRVEEEVAADSPDARLAPAPQASSSNAGGVPLKRTSNLSSLVSTLGSKKQKLSTLEKTKLDWQSYKSKEGLEDELLLHTKSKDTYLDKQEFLQRSDVRQFEIERDIRQGARRTNR